MPVEMFTAAAKVFAWIQAALRIKETYTVASTVCDLSPDSGGDK